MSVRGICLIGIHATNIAHFFPSERTSAEIVVDTVLPRRSMVQLLVVLGVFSIYAQYSNALKSNRTHKLLDSLRRKLMEDNYNYMESGESAQITTQPPHELPITRAKDLDNSEYLYEEFHSMQKRSDSSEPKIHVRVSEETTRRETIEEQLEPLIDLSHRALRYSNLYNAHFREQAAQETQPAGETTARFELLEIAAKPGKRLWSGRRSGAVQGKVRRFLQEEKKDEVVIVPLDHGPVPEFRLPSGRRQFMGGVAMSDDDLWSTIPSLPDLMGLPRTEPTPPPLKRRFRAPQPDTEASVELDLTKRPAQDVARRKF